MKKVQWKCSACGLPRFTNRKSKSGLCENCAKPQQTRLGFTCFVCKVEYGPKARRETVMGGFIQCHDCGNELRKLKKQMGEVA